ncbi:MAG: glutathione S-transferase family protein [Gammaproteobacteria bacterium]|nr:glutathione S-transferase family protein [Gammaproteobacteria bacterium]
MKLLEMTGAPNPRRVRIFLAEKGVEVPLVQVDMRQGEHKTPAFLKKNPSGKIPVLELDDGTCIAESVAICRYFEALHPEPNLFGAPPVEAARIEMTNRQLEFELLASVGTAWRNGPIVAAMAAGRFTQIPEAKTQGEDAARAYYVRLDAELAQQPFVAGERFTVADITALVTVDFATNLVELKPDDELTDLWRWHAEVSARPSADA